MFRTYARFAYGILPLILAAGFLSIPTAVDAAWVCASCSCDCGGTTVSAPWPSGATALTDPQAICVAQCQLRAECAGAVTRDQAQGVSCREVPDEPAAGSEPTPTRTPGEFGYVNPLGTVNLNVVLGRVIRTVLGFVGALFLAMFVYGGTLWMVAGGDAKKVESGRKAIINAVIGMVVIAISYSIISIIFETASVIRGG